MIQNLVSKFSVEFNDPRYFQVFYLGSFLLFGVAFLGWENEVTFFLSVFSAALITQLVFTYFTTKRYTSWKSAMITALGLCLLLKTNGAWIGALAAVLAISSKFLIKYKLKHIFNPANLGIIAVIVLTGEAWVSPGQWGSSALLWFVIGAAGLMIILKVGRLDTSVCFLATFAGLQFIYQVLYLGWEPAVWLHKMSNGTLLLYTFFMITDPMTTPNHPTARKLWAVALAILLFIASTYFYVQTAAIWVLFFVSPLTPFIDKKFKALKYEWSSNKSYQSNNKYIGI